MKIPVYQTYQQQDLLSNPKFKVQRIKINYAIDARQRILYCFYSLVIKQKILKAIVGTLLTRDNKKQLTIVIQYEKEIIIQSFNSHTFHEQFQTNSTIPIIAQDGQLKVSQSGLQMYIFVHSKVENSEYVNLLELFQQEIPKFSQICEIKGQQIVAMNQYERMLITLDDSLNVKIFSYNHQCQQFCLFKESELIGDAAAFVKYYQQNIITNQKSPQCISLARTEAYIGPSVFNFHTFSSETRFGGKEFEMYRSKYISQMTVDNLIKGPIASLDNSYLLYVVIEAEQEDSIEESQNELNTTAMHMSLFKQTKIDTEQEDNQVKEEVLLVDKGKSFQGRKQNAYFQSMKATKNKNNSQKAIQAKYDPLDVLNSSDSNVIERTLSKEVKLKQKIFCIPYIGCKSFSFLHKDKYSIEKIKFSTFTVYEDIFIMIDSKCLIFGKDGRSINIDIDPDDQAFLNQGEIELKRVCNHQIQEAGQTFLFELKSSYLLFHLLFSGDFYTFKMIKDEAKRQINLEEGATEVNDETYVYRDIKQDCKGNLWVVSAEANNSLLEVQIIQNGVSIDWIGQMISDKINSMSFPFFSSQKNQKPASSSQVFHEYSEIVPENTDFQYLKLQIDMFKNMFDFEIIHNRFFIFKVEKSIFFYNMLSYDPQNSLQEIDLNLREGFITQILQTQKWNLIQFVFIQTYPVSVSFIITWNLESNMEDQILELPAKLASPLSVNVLKGTHERLNYYVPVNDQVIYDLRFNFPFSYFLGMDACINHEVKVINNMSHFNGGGMENQSEGLVNIMNKRKGDKYRNELKFSAKSEMLGIAQEQYAKMYISYSILDLQYIEFLQIYYKSNRGKETEADQEIQQLIPPLLKWKLLCGKNILHLFCTNYKFLKLYFEEIKFLIEDANYKDGERHIFYLLNPNNKGQSPFDIAMKDKAFKCVELMLDMLSYKPNYNFSKYLKKHFYVLLSIQSKSFLNYLNTCTFEIKQFVKVKWPFKQDRVLLSHNSSYIDDKFICDNFGVSLEDIQQNHRVLEIEEKQKDLHLIKQASNLQNELAEVETKAGFEYEEPIKIQNKKQAQSQDCQNVVFEAIEFEYIFRGEPAKEFLAHLDSQDGTENLFRLQIIEDVILFQWNQFFRPFLVAQFIPFLLMFTCIVVFTILAHIDIEQKSGNQNITQMIFLSGKWKQFHMACGILIIIFSTYFLQTELRKLYKQRNILNFDFGYPMFIATVVVYYCNVSKRVYTIMAVVMVIQAYMQLFLRLRLFDKTAVLITTTFYVVRDMIIFTLIFFLMVIGYGNAFYIASGLQRDGGEPFAGDNFGLAFFYSYSMVLGNFDSTVYNSLGSDQWIALLCFLSCSFMGSVVLLNMIIAIMNDTYDSVMQIQKEERLMAKCNIMNEFSFIFMRDYFFKSTKYIIIAKIDSVTSEGDDWEGKVNNIKGYLKMKTDMEQEKINNNFKGMRSMARTLQNQIRVQDSKVCDIQESLLKVLGQLNNLEQSHRMKSIMKSSKVMLRNAFQQQLRVNVEPEHKSEEKKEQRKTGLIKRVLDQKSKQGGFAELVQAAKNKQ